MLIPSGCAFICPYPGSISAGCHPNTNDLDGAERIPLLRWQFVIAYGLSGLYLHRSLRCSPSLLIDSLKQSPTVLLNRRLLHCFSLSLDALQFFFPVAANEKEQCRPEHDTNTHRHGVTPRLVASVSRYFLDTAPEPAKFLSKLTATI